LKIFETTLWDLTTRSSKRYRKVHDVQSNEKIGGTLDDVKILGLSQTKQEREVSIDANGFPDQSVADSGEILRGNIKSVSYNLRDL
jgi:hypothetical protein